MSQFDRRLVKFIGVNGQLSLGKEFAGKLVVINQVEKGMWIIKSGEFIPDSEKWLHEEENLAKIEKALKWAARNKPNNNFKKFIKAL